MKKSVRKKVYDRIPSLDGAELHQSLQYLDNERHVLNIIFNSLQEAILLTDIKGNLILHNDSAQQLLALPTNPSTLAPLWHWIPLLKSFFTKTSKKVLPDVLAKETQLLYPEHRWVRLHMHRFLENAQNRFVIVLQDITQERSASEKRVQQERFDSIVQLASEVAHELGNPLNSIHIHLQLLQRHLTTHLQQVRDACTEHLQTLQQTLASLQLPTETTAGLQSSIQTYQASIDGMTISPSIAQSLHICQEEVRRLDEIIQHFLKAVRPQPLNLKRDNPIATLKAVLSVLQPQLDNAKIAIEWSIATPLTTIFVDTARLHQVFFNVLKNAMEAIGTNGRIRISCYQTERDWVVAFADSGGGSNLLHGHVRHPIFPKQGNPGLQHPCQPVNGSIWI